MQVGLKDERRGSQPLQRVYFIEAKRGSLSTNLPSAEPIRVKRRRPEGLQEKLHRIYYIGDKP